MVAGDTMRIGALLRAYSPKPEGIDSLVEGIANTVRKLDDVGILDVQIGIWADQGNPAADCGETFVKMILRFAGHPNIHVHKTETGDLFVTILNEGIKYQLSRGLTHSLILSWEAASFIDHTLINKLRRSISRGALAVAVALPEIVQFVLQGAIMNTLALWNIKELLDVGGFDPHDTKPRFADHYAGSNAGVGEFIPLLKMAERLKRPVLDIVMPTKSGAITVPPEREELQRKKMESKQHRIDGMLKEIGKTPEDLKSTIMPYVI